MSIYNDWVLHVPLMFTATPPSLPASLCLFFYSTHTTRMACCCGSHDGSTPRRTRRERGISGWSTPRYTASRRCSSSSPAASRLAWPARSTSQVGVRCVLVCA